MENRANRTRQGRTQTKIRKGGIITASGKIKGITIEIGGDTTKLGKSLQDSEKQTRQLQRELKEVDRLLKFNPDNVDLIRQKQELLTKAIDETSKKLNILKDAEKDVIAQFERGDIGEEQLRAFQREIIQTDSKLTNLRAKLEQVNSTLEDTDKTTTDTRNSFEKLKDTISEQESELSSLRKEYSNIVLEQGESSQEAQDLAKRILSLNDELQDNKRKLNDAEQAANDLGNEYKEAGDSAKTAEGGFTILKGALANLASDAIQGAISKIQEFIQGLFELSEATEEYRLMQAKLSGSAQTFGYDIDFVKEKYKEFYSYLGDDQAATNAITNLEGMGASTETVSKSAEAAIAVWTAYGDSIPIESLTESINESSQVAKVTGVLADALNWAGISEDDFNAKLETCNSTQERADLIAQTLNDRYGESKARFDEMSGSILESNKAQLELKDTQAQLGQAMEPVNTALTEMKNDSLGKLVPIVETCADAFLKFKNWLDEGGAAATIAQAALVGLGTAAGVAATAFGAMLIIKTVTAAINAAKVAMAALNITMSLNPIVLVVAAIAGLVAAFVMLWNKSEEFRDFWTGLWDTIKTAAGNALDAIVNFFAQLPSRIWTFLQTAWTNVSTWVSQMVQKAVEVGSQFLQNVVSFFTQLPSKVWGFLTDAISKAGQFVSQMGAKAKEAGTQFLNNVVSFVQKLPSKVWGFLTDAISKAGQFVSQMGTKAKEAGQRFFDNITQKLSEIPERVVSIGGDIVRGIWNGITESWDWIVGKISEFCGGILGGFKSALGIASPSKVMRDQIGKWIPAGVAEGIVENEDEPVQAFENMQKNLLDTAVDVNGLNFNSRLDSTFGGSNASFTATLMSMYNLLSNYLPKLLDKQQEIYWDSGELIGATINKIDAGMGKLNTLKARGV